MNCLFSTFTASAATIQISIKSIIIHFFNDFSLVSQSELPLHAYASLCTFCFQLFQAPIHYLGHITAISSTASLVFVFYLYHSIVIAYVKLKVFKTSILNFYE